MHDAEEETGQEEYQLLRSIDEVDDRIKALQSKVKDVLSELSSGSVSKEGS